MEFKINGCKITVFPSFMIMICLVLLIDKTGIMLFSLLSALIHETGHIVFIILSKKKISKILFQIGGIIIDSKGVTSYKNEFVIAIGGCLLNFIFFLISLLLFVKTNNELYMIFSATNLGLFLFNLMPIENLDGMDLLRIFLNKYFDFNKSKTLSKIISYSFIFISFLFSLFLILQYKIKPVILICLIYLLILSIIFNKQNA